jgi:hypothetical protein
LISDVYANYKTNTTSIAVGTSLSNKADTTAIYILTCRKTSEVLFFSKLLIQRMDDDGLINANAYVGICELNWNTNKNTTQIIVNRIDILDSLNDHRCRMRCRTLINLCASNICSIVDSCK